MNLNSKSNINSRWKNRKRRTIQNRKKRGMMEPLSFYHKVPIYREPVKIQKIVSSFSVPCYKWVDDEKFLRNKLLRLMEDELEDHIKITKNINYETGSTTYSSILQIVDDEPKENVGDYIVKN